MAEQRRPIEPMRKPRHTRIAAVLSVCALLLHAPSVTAQQISQAAPLPKPGEVNGDPLLGEPIAKRWCADCHALGDGPTASDQAPGFGAIARGPRGTPEQIRAFLTQPHAPMPPLQLSRNEIENLIAYIRQLGNRP